MTAAFPVSTPGTLIVGAGQAGSELAAQLRRNGYRKPVLLIGEESVVPYRRPPLSKAFLAGEATLESLHLRPESFYVGQEIECVTGVRAEHIDRAARTARLSDGREIGYETLVFATGGRPRRLTLPGADRSNVHYLRTAEDIVRLQDDFLPGRRLVIIGGGYIGLETAAVGIKKGLDVAVVETQPRVLARVTSPPVSAFYERSHRERGVAFHTGVSVEAFEGHERVDTVVLADGRRLPADLVIVAVGLLPNVELAEAAGLEIGNGIVVDADARTSDPHIYAIGDCSNHWNGFADRQVRLESVASAIEQARAAAAAICGVPAPAVSAPWFWSDQYDLKLQTVGLADGYDALVVRGNPDTARFSVFYLRNGVLIAVDAINCAQDFLVAKRLVGARARIDAAGLADETCALSTHLPVEPRPVADAVATVAAPA